MTQRPKFRRAFTLIELLVVIAIIAILAAILFPVFAKARDRAKLSTCLSNMKQVGVQFTMYASDNDQRMPFAKDPVDGNYFESKLGVPSLPLVWSAMRSYGGTFEHWRCPSDTGYYAARTIAVDDKGAMKSVPARRPWHRYHNGGSYWYNTRLGVQHPVGATAKVGGRPMDSLPSRVAPTDLILAYEPGFWHTPEAAKDATALSAKGKPLSVMLDGHARQFPTYSKWRTENYDKTDLVTGTY